MSSTSTLTIKVCGCSNEGIAQSCNAEAYVLPIGLSMGALIAILACIILLLGTYSFTGQKDFHMGKEHLSAVEHMLYLKKLPF